MASSVDDLGPPEESSAFSADESKQIERLWATMAPVATRKPPEFMEIGDAEFAVRHHRDKPEVKALVDSLHQDSYPWPEPDKLDHLGPLKRVFDLEQFAAALATLKQQTGESFGELLQQIVAAVSASPDQLQAEMDAIFTTPTQFLPAMPDDAIALPHEPHRFLTFLAQPALAVRLGYGTLLDLFDSRRDVDGTVIKSTDYERGRQDYHSSVRDSDTTHARMVKRTGGIAGARLNTKREDWWLNENLVVYPGTISTPSCKGTMCEGSEIPPALEGDFWHYWAAGGVHLGDVALHVAARAHNDVAVRWLLGMKATMSRKNDAGLTAYACAEADGDLEAAARTQACFPAEFRELASSLKAATEGKGISAVLQQRRAEQAKLQADATSEVAVQEVPTLGMHGPNATKKQQVLDRNAEIKARRAEARAIALGKGPAANTAPSKAAGPSKAVGAPSKAAGPSSPVPKLKLSAGGKSQQQQQRKPKASPSKASASKASPARGSGSSQAAGGQVKSAAGGQVKSLEDQLAQLKKAQAGELNALKATLNRAKKEASTGAPSSPSQSKWSTAGSPAAKKSTATTLLAQPPWSPSPNRAKRVGPKYNSLVASRASH